MATISITIPDAQVPRVLMAFGARAAFPARAVGAPVEPATAAEVRAAIIAWARDVVRDYEHQEAVKQAFVGVTPVDIT